MDMHEEALRRIAKRAQERLPELLENPSDAVRVAEAISAALDLPAGPLAQLALQRALRGDRSLEKWALEAIHTAESRMRAEPGAAPPARYLKTTLPRRARGGTKLALHAAITLDGGPGSVPTRPFPVPAGGVDVLITVASETLLIETDSVCRVRVYPDADSDTALFVMGAQTEGSHDVKVRAFLADGGGELSAVVRTVLIDPYGLTEPPRTVSTRVEHLAGQPGGITLQIDRRAGGLAFRLIGPDPREAYSDAVPPNLIADLSHDVHQMAVGTGAFSPATARRRLADYGMTLWGMLPGEIRELVAARLDAASGLTICSDLSALPWELLTSPAQDDFIAARLPVVRQTGTHPLTRSLTLLDPIFVLGRNPPAGAESEVSEVFARLVEPGNATKIMSQEELVRRIDAGDFSLLHLACHQEHPEAGHGGVNMIDGHFRPVALARAAQNHTLGVRCPLVFFNACRSVDGGTYDTLMGGWANEFLRAGAGAFVGSTWTVRSESARRYARVFYDELVAGTPLGQASLLARSDLLDNAGDPTGLAYAVYGDPEATVNERGES